MLADTVPLIPTQSGIGLAGWTVIISTITAGIVSIVNAIGNFWGRSEARQTASHIKDTVVATTAKLETADHKLDVIHDLTNSSMTALKAQLATALARIDTLETILSKGTHRPPA